MDLRAAGWTGGALGSTNGVQFICRSSIPKLNITQQRQQRTARPTDACGLLVDTPRSLLAVAYTRRFFVDSYLHRATCEVGSRISS